MNINGCLDRCMASGNATTIPFNAMNGTSSFSRYFNFATDKDINASSELTYENYEYENYSLDDNGTGICSNPTHGASFLPVLYIFFFILGLLGNVLVLWVILQGVRLRSMTDVCLLNLVLADMLLVCSLPFLAQHSRDQWVFGDFMCKAVLSVYYIGFYSGIFFITLMSVDRYLAIVHAIYAIKARTRKHGAIAATVTWIAGILASFPEALLLKVSRHNGKDNCRPEYQNDIFWRMFGFFKLNTLGLLIPLAIMGFCYTQIVRTLFNAPSSKKQAIRLIVIVVVVFLCCWTPYNVASFFKALEIMTVVDLNCEGVQAMTLTLQITEAMAYSHSCLNPILYVFVGQKFRRHLIRLINKAPCRLCQFMKNYLPREIRTSRTGSVYSQTTSMDENSTAI